MPEITYSRPVVAVDAVVPGVVVAPGDAVAVAVVVAAAVDLDRPFSLYKPTLERQNVVKSDSFLLLFIPGFNVVVGSFCAYDITVTVYTVLSVL
jgi:hypothetical protein